jgi:hypothetical protein
MFRGDEGPVKAHRICLPIPFANHTFPTPIHLPADIFWTISLLRIPRFFPSAAQLHHDSIPYFKHFTSINTFYQLQAHCDFIQWRFSHNLTAEMASHYLHDERNEEFIQFVHRELQPGVDGDGQKVEFISPKKTEKWWKKGSENRIARAINHNINARVATIEKAYLNIFSILVYSSKTSLIKEFISNGFQDQQLPLLDTKRFGTDRAIVKDMEEFYENQWMFCPVMFLSTTPMDRRTIPRRQILPIKDEKITTTKANHSKSVVRVVTLHPECYDKDWSSSVSLSHPLSSTFTDTYQANCRLQRISHT